jgi:hypothetical protein
MLIFSMIVIDYQVVTDKIIDKGGVTSFTLSSLANMTLEKKIFHV